MENHTIYLILAFVFLAIAAILTALFKRKRNSFYMLFGGVICSAYMVFLPIYSQRFVNDEWGNVKTSLIALHNTFRLFIMDGEFDIISNYASCMEGAEYVLYTVFAAVLYVLAPLLTFGFVLSFFKSFLSYLSYAAHCFSETYIFTELNSNSLELAKNLKENNKRRTIVFTGITEKVQEEKEELVEKARKVGVIFFKKNITLHSFLFHYVKSKLVFFAIDENESESLEHALHIVKKYGHRECAELYVFAAGIESELILNSVIPDKMKVRRVDEAQIVINELLYEDGIKIFESAVPYDEENKLISAVIIGLGSYGTQMARALPWFCQMDGYHTEINIFEMDGTVADKYVCSCPELLDEKHNGDFDTEGEAHYKIDVHYGVDVDQIELWEILETIPSVSYVFVAIGSDEKNIRTAIELRTYFEKRGISPRIDAVVFDSGKKQALQGIKNYSGQEYHINFVGDRATAFSEKVVMHSELEAIALDRHLKWGTEDEFWRFEYNYRSSVASAIHRKMKSLCGIPGADKPKEERNETELWNLRKLEHRRWNAYMRAHGFTWAEKRNNLAKTHHCLVPFEELSVEDQEKDDD